ncbi:MAG TPA: hypothetical protein PKK26_16320, partial [Candidatus Wallbacteria bacterium]|nr:hypothetical protein [Candidatus Wallbacteria bacterium]
HGSRDQAYGETYVKPYGAGGFSDAEGPMFADNRFRDLSWCFASALIGSYSAQAASVYFINQTLRHGSVFAPSYVLAFLAGIAGALAGIAVFINYRKTDLIAKENGGMEGFFRDSLFFVICALFFSSAFKNMFYFLTSIFIRDIGTTFIICGTTGMETVGAYIGINFGLALNRNFNMNFSRIKSAPQQIYTMALAIGHGFLGGVCAFIFSFIAFEMFFDLGSITRVTTGFYILHFVVTIITSLAVSAGMYYGIARQKRE